MKRFSLFLGCTILLVLYLAALLAPFLSPYEPRRQFRNFNDAPPSRIRWRDQSGSWHGRPLVYAIRQQSLQPSYIESGKTFPLHFLVEGFPYTILGVPSRLHLFGLEPGAGNQKVFLFGTDLLGRDLFSRLLYGARFSLTIGVVSILCSLFVGVMLGSVAGYWGGWWDTAVMRLVDLFLTVPAMFLILGIRAVFPIRLSAGQTFWLMALIFSLMGWPLIARVIRGQAAALKERGHVLAARASGASTFRILWHHILPFSLDYILVQSTFLIPAFILGEVTLSFLGVGIQEPDASWGTLLVSATSLRAISHSPWLLSPAAFIFLTVLAFNLLGEYLKDLPGRRLPQGKPPRAEEGSEKALLEW